MNMDLKMNFYAFGQVVYAIMHRQEVFQPFKNHPRFTELLENIYNVCSMTLCDESHCLISYTWFLSEKLFWNSLNIKIS